MKSLEELSKRFDSIPELPVSEEMLCAYTEGKLSPIEKYYLSDKIEHSPLLDVIVNDVNLTDGNNLVDLDGWISYEEINTLPELPNVESSPIVDSGSWVDDSFGDHSHMLAACVSTPIDFDYWDDAASDSDEILKPSVFFSDNDDRNSDRGYSMDIDDKDTDIDGINSIDDLNI